MLDSYQPSDQAGFRSESGTNEYLQVIKSLKEKSIEYKKPLILVCVDYEKAFDTIDLHKMLLALAYSPIDHRYSTLINNIYDKATAFIRLHEDMNKFGKEPVVRQGETISPKLFTAVLEYMCKRMHWNNVGINMNGGDLNHLRLADDIVLISDRIGQATKMLEKLHQASKVIGVKINTSKTMA